MPTRSQANIPGSCLGGNSGDAVVGGLGGLGGGLAQRGKGDFVLQTGHVIEIVTKLFLVVQNATGKPPGVNISTEFEANFGGFDSVSFAFKKAGSAGVASIPTSGGTSSTAMTPAGQIKLVKRGNKFEVIV